MRVYRPKKCDTIEANISRLYPAVIVKENHQEPTASIIIPKKKGLNHIVTTVGGVQVNLYRCENMGHITQVLQFNETEGFGYDPYAPKKNTVNYTKTEKKKWKKIFDDAKLRIGYSSATYLKVPGDVQSIICCGGADGFIDVISVINQVRFMSIQTDDKQDIYHCSSNANFMLLTVTMDYIRIYDLCIGKEIHCIKSSNNNAALQMGNDVIITKKGGKIFIQRLKEKTEKSFYTITDKDEYFEEGFVRGDIVQIKLLYQNYLLLQTTNGKIMIFTYSLKNMRVSLKLQYAACICPGVTTPDCDIYEVKSKKLTKRMFYFAFSTFEHIHFFRFWIDKNEFHYKKVFVMSYPLKDQIEFNYVQISKNQLDWIVVGTDKGYVIKFEPLQDERVELFETLQAAKKEKKDILAEFEKTIFQCQKDYVELAKKKGYKINEYVKGAQKKQPIRLLKKKRKI